jgi:Cu+-exporting ATPase
MPRAYNPPMQNPTHIKLQIAGMHCAACSARLEKVLNQLPQITARVNITTSALVFVPL